MPLTSQDELKIRIIVGQEVKKEIKLEVRKIVKEEIEIGVREIVKEEVAEQVGFLPTKDEFFNWMDKIYGELQTVRQEQTFLSAQISRAIGQNNVLERKFQMLSRDFQKHALS